MTDLYILFDIPNSVPLQGPCELPNDLHGLSNEELYALNWYKALPFEYDVGEAFNSNVYDVSGPTYSFVETPFPAVKRYIVTQPKPLEVVQWYVTRSLTEFRDNLFNQGFTWGGVAFDGDVKSRLNWTAAVSATVATGYLNGLTVAQLAGLPGYQPWTRKDNQTAHFSRVEILQCGLALAGWASNCFQYCRTLKTQAINEETFEAVWQIWLDNDVANWPSPNFGGTLSLEQPVFDPEFNYTLPAGTE